MHIKYAEYWNDNKEISETDLPNYEEYQIQYFKQSELLKSEFIKNGNLVYVNYFIQKGTSHLETLSNESNLYILISEVDFVNNYKHIRTFSYNEKQEIEGISNRLFDSKNNLIAKDFTRDLLNFIPEYEFTKKYYYDEKIRPDDLFECCFTEEGKLIPIDIDIEEIGMGDHDGTWIYDTEEGIKELINIFGMTRDLAAYYLKPNIIP